MEAETFLQPRLETDRLILEAFKETDLADILAYASHSEIAKYVPWEAHKTIEDSKNFYKFIQDSSRTTRGKLFFVFAIRLKESGRVIGSIDFKNPSSFCGQTDYALGYSFWGKGIMTEAANSVKNWAFESLPELIRFQAFCIADNIGSARVMEKIGMQREGLRRKAFILKGKPVDLIDYSAIR